MGITKGRDMAEEMVLTPCIKVDVALYKHPDDCRVQGYAKKCNIFSEGWRTEGV